MSGRWRRRATVESCVQLSSRASTRANKRRAERPVTALTSRRAPPKLAPFGQQGNGGGGAFNKIRPKDCCLAASSGALTRARQQLASGKRQAHSEPASRKAAQLREKMENFLSICTRAFWLLQNMCAACVSFKWPVLLPLVGVILRVAGATQLSSGLCSLNAVGALRA